MHCVIAVPARLESTRLPEKIRAKIGDKPMFQWVLEACARANQPKGLALCTDSNELCEEANALGFNAIYTQGEFESGTDRIASVLDELISLGEGDLNSTAIINVQGDQPFIDPEIIDKICLRLGQGKESPDVVTPIYRLDQAAIHNPDKVKVVISHRGEAIYFSRNAIPYIRDIELDSWVQHHNYWGHVGIYGYKATTLKTWPKLNCSTLEKAEKLEQLRLVQCGVRIGTVEVSGEPLSVDTLEDLEKARCLIRTNKSIN